MADLLTAAALRFDLHGPSVVVDAGDGTEVGRWERWGRGGQALFDRDGRLVYQAQPRPVPGKRFRRAWSLLAQPAGPGAPPVEGWIGRVHAPPVPEPGGRRTAYELGDALVAVEVRTTRPLELDVLDPETMRPMAYVRTKPLSGLRERLTHDVPYTWSVEFPRPLAPALRCLVFAGMYRARRAEVSNASVG